MKKLAFAAALISMAAICSASAISIDFNNDNTSSLPSNGAGYIVKARAQRSKETSKTSKQRRMATPRNIWLYAEAARLPSLLTLLRLTSFSCGVRWIPATRLAPERTGVALSVFTLSGKNFTYSDGDTISNGMVNLHGTFTYSTLTAAFASLTFASDLNLFELDDINTRAPTKTPDGGTTAGLLILAMLGVVAMRRQFNAA